MVNISISQLSEMRFLALRASSYTISPRTCRSGEAYLDVALAVDEQVLGLQIPIDEVQVVQVLERQHNLGRVEPRVRLAAGVTEITGQTEPLGVTPSHCGVTGSHARVTTESLGVIRESPRSRWELYELPRMG